MNEQTLNAILLVLLAISELMALNPKLKDSGILQFTLRLIRGSIKR